MRIALGGIATESCTFTSLRTRREDFTVLRGDELADRYPWRFPGAELVPTLRARALPGGPVQGAVYDELKREFCERLRAGAPWDGLYLDLHGAMFVEGREDAEGDWIASAREIVGPDCLLAASYDLHGNVSVRVFDELDLITAYRTAPHTDEEETRERAVALLVRCLREGVRPEKALASVPLLLSGERTSTEWEPGEGLYARLPEMIAAYGVLDASILVGYAWADEPRARASVVAYGTVAAAVHRAAETLAREFWELRHRFEFGSPAAGIDDSIRAALAAPEESVFLCDSGDNPTAGGVGDLTHVLARLLAAGVESAVFASVADPEAVRACRAAGEGTTVDLNLGGKLDPSHGAPLPVRGRVRALDARDPANRQAVVRVGGIDVILTERRTPFHHLSQFRELGIDPLERRIVAVKIGYLEPDLAHAAPKTFLVLSPGAVDQDLARLPFRRVTRPIYPLDPEMAWDMGAGDRRRAP